MIKRFFALNNKKKVKFEKIKIALIGGGTGLSSLIMGLKKYNEHISAIVTVTDDGGSSGRLRKEYGILPPGDIRNCLVSLAEEDNLMSKLFSYRFGGSGEMAGHNFGNLFIMAMSDVFGGFEKGILEASKILATKGNVIPATFQKVQLIAEKEDGRLIYGETNIANAKGKIKNLHIEPKNCKGALFAFQAISSADVIILGPGSFYTSVISNLLIQDIKDALIKAKALKIFVCNIMSQPGETSGYSTKDYLDILERYVGENVVDCILVNNSEIPKKLLKIYEQKDSHPIKDDFKNEDSKEKTVKVLGDFFGEKISENSIYARHDPLKLAKVIKKLVEGQN
jgi:uncharacterized cofD-like protein